MSTLWILQTNEQLFLDDCRKFQVYGAPKPDYMNLSQMNEGDTILLRLKLRQAETEFGYLGPYFATSKIKAWVNRVEQTQGIWQKIAKQANNSPSWLPRFPWCIFLSPTRDYISDLRQLSLSTRIQACTPIISPRSEQIIQQLEQMEFLPKSKANSYRTFRGVWVRSRAEYMIDNWFAEHGIVTYYEKSIYVDSIKITPDWFIPSLGLYVEYLGMKGNPNYDNAWKFKEKIYRKHGIKFVTFEDTDLTDLDNTIPAKLPGLKNLGVLK